MMRRKIQFAGIDGSGKSTCLDLLISELVTKYKILKLASSSAPEEYYGERTCSAIKYYTPKLVDSIRRIAKKYRCYGFFLILNLLCKQLATKYLELFKSYDLIVYETDTLIHPASYITFHFPVLRAIDQKVRYKIISRLFYDRKTTTIIFLDVQPQVAMERIYRRGTTLDPHESHENLDRLRTEMHSILNLAKQDGFNIVRIETDDKAPKDVLKEILLALQERHKICAGKACPSSSVSVVNG